ncbi:lytic transglycosylase domain-containing protein [Rhodobacteraceae bacterium MYP1-1]|uniref:Lytic transglycosylase domain-containing protein n=1 Tax=Halocynthiibacter styelae TaxID=2761955 RepID=A0A8J7LKW7_9RHOB|nr:lytic transglycosylase domain-containing protein [Paenihalocynthiibacter styelae]
MSCVGGCVYLLLLAQPCLSQGFPNSGDFSARWISVPESFEGRRRIDVQIDPEEQARALALPTGSNGSVVDETETVATVAPTDTAESLPFAWFWKEVSPALSDSAPNSLELAEQVLSNSTSEESSFPRMQNLQSIAEKYGGEILGATVGTKVSPALVLAVIGVESAGREDAVSSAGAGGLMQLMPATAERFGVTDRMDPVQNLRGGVAYLDWLMGEFNYDPIMVLAAYNAGENAVKRNNGVPEYAETRGYVPKVVAAWTIARGLCTTPPELATDGCVFYVNLAGNDG